MKTKQIKGAVDIMLIIPDDEPSMQAEADLLDIEEDGWQFHCRLSEMTEDQAEQLAARVTWGDGFKNHKLGDSQFLAMRSACESLQTLFQANGIQAKNPYGENDDTGHNARDREWQEAEAKVFPPETTLVFIKE